MSEPLSPAPRRIHVVYKTHLDLGYTDFAAATVERYLRRFIPDAIAVARELREGDSAERFVWTVGSWLIWEYLERADRSERAAMESAIAAGDVVWTVMPFTMHAELADPETFRYGLSLSRRLDERFGRRTVAAKITDVPGASVGVLPFLVEAGVECLFIGANGATKPPQLPEVFRWRWDGDEVICVYQNSYGGFVQPVGLEDALSLEFTYDNVGPLTRTAVVHSQMQLQQRFPDAVVSASTLDAFAERLVTVRDQLPLVEAEIGDTWINGVASDPLKVARYRELARLRDEKLAEHALPHENADAISAALLLIPEHTWGLDDMVHLGDYSNWDNEAFDRMRTTDAWRRYQSSWAEQRNPLDRAVEAFADGGFAEEVGNRLALLTPGPRDDDLWVPLQESSLENERVIARFDDLGALVELHDKLTSEAWATGDHRLGFVTYEVFDSADYETYLSTYVLDEFRDVWWVEREMGKRGLGRLGVFAEQFEPRVRSAWHHTKEPRVRFELEFPRKAIDQFGCPATFTLEWTLDRDRPGIDAVLEWKEKRPTRIPEAIWISFVPAGISSAWMLDKMGTLVPSDSVVPGGSRRLHSIRERVSASSANGGTFELYSFDAPLVSVGRPLLLDRDDEVPDPAGGVHVNLLNTTWATNFPAWYQNDGRFRFTIKLGDGHPLAHRPRGS